MRSIEGIDAEIVQARDELIALRRQKNYMSATQRLPPEVLVRILRLADRDEKWHVSYSGEYKVTHPLTWMGILHVCSRWREMCLNFPGYWTSVPTWNTHWMQLALARSGVAPINLYYGGNDKNYPLSSTAALEHLPRVRTLRVEHPYFNEQDTWFLPFLKTHPAPLLEHFDFGPAGPRSRWSRLDYLHAQSLDLADTPLFQGVVPRLHSLVLWQIRIAPSSALLAPTLRYLDLSCVPRQWRWTYQQLRDVLGRLPQLKDLRLLNALPLTTASITMTYASPLELPWLAHLSLRIERCQEAHDFFTHFLIPATAFVDIDSECTHPHSLETRQLIA